MTEDRIVEEYKGVQIWYYDDIQALDTLEYGGYSFIYGNRRYAYSTVGLAKAQIDDLIGAGVRREPRFIGEYRGERIYRDLDTGRYFTPRLPIEDRDIAVIRSAIDALLGPEPEEAPSPEEPEPEEERIEVQLVEAPALPWYASWLEPIINYIGGLTETVVNYATVKLAPLKAGIQALVTLPGDIVGALLERMGELMQGGRDKGAEMTTSTFQEVLSGTEPWMTELQGSIEETQSGSFDVLNQAISEGLAASAGGDPNASAEALEALRARILQVAIANFTIHAVIESGSLGQVEFMKDLDPMVMSKFGLDEVARRATLLPIEKAVLNPAEQAYNRLHPNVIPSASELINMVVKEVIPLDQFKGEMLKLGFKESWSQAIWDAHFIPPDYTQITQALYRGVVNREQYEVLKRLVDLDPRFDAIWDGLVEQVPPLSELVNERVKEVITQETFTRYVGYYGLSAEWAERIWQAHFIPPTLGDLLTAWRRGVIDTERLDELMVIVDLDPRFKDIFDTRRYVDPSLTEARFMFETGAIDEDRVREIVLRSGYTPRDTDDLVQWIVRFQERRFRTGYLLSVATGAIYGAYTEEEVVSEVTDAGYTEAVAEWILKAADARNKTRIARARSPAPKLLSTGDIKKAYLRDRISEDQLRTELSLRGYPIGDIEILVGLLEDDRVTTEAGGRKVALSQSELLNAWRYDQLTEDSLRTELSLRGLAQDEIDILLATKRVQWGLT